MNFKRVLYLCLLTTATLSLNAERKISFIIQTGTSYTLAGYHEKEYGDVGSTTLEETEFMPGFYMNQLQFALGKQVSESLYLGFMVGGWVNTDLSSYAITNASLYTKYAFSQNDMSPILTCQGGLFMENFPESYLGFVLNPAMGLEMNRSGNTPLHVTLGYLLTFYDFEGTDPGNENYINNEGEQRHGLTLTGGISF